MLAPGALGLVGDTFQSAPGQLAGRCAELHDIIVDDLKFQSAPGQLAGRCGPGMAGIPELGGFNPRPASWPGDATRVVPGRMV